MQAGYNGRPRPLFPPSNGMNRPDFPSSNKRKEVPTNFELLIKNTVQDIRSKRVKQENDYNPADMIEYVYGLKSEDPHLQEEVVDEGPVEVLNGGIEETQYRSYWKLDEDMAELWENAISAECNADVDLPKPDKDEKVLTPVTGHYTADEGTKKEGISLLSTDTNLTHTVQLMYTLAQVMQPQPDSPEAMQLSAALEAMGQAEFLIKRLRAKQECESIDEGVERRLQLHSWESQPQQLWDQTKIKHNTANLTKASLNKSTFPLTSKGYGNDVPQFFCELCNIGTPGQGAFDDHLAGKTHVRKQMASFGVKKTSSQVRCDVCAVLCSDDKCYQAHIVGQKHLRVVKLKQSLNLP